MAKNGKLWRKTNGLLQTLRKKTPASALIEVGPEALWIFAHPPISLNDLDSWSNNLAKSPSTKITSIGKSLESRPIKQLTLGNPDATNFVFILGRQHPRKSQVLLG